MRGNPTTDDLILSEMEMALFVTMKANHRPRVIPVRGIVKIKTGIQESKKGAFVTLWIPVFFGRDRTVEDVPYANTILYE